MSIYYLAEGPRDSPDNFLWLGSIADVRALPRHTPITIFAVPGWEKRREYAGVVGLCAARGYDLRCCPMPSSEATIKS